MKVTLEIEVDVEYLYIRGYPATREEPGEESYIEIQSVKYNGHPIELTDEHFEAVVEAAEQDWEDGSYY